LIGGTAGILFGWLITRIGSIIAKIIMQRQDIPVIELFHLPLWLIVFAAAFGIIISIIAGILPAIRAARVDPVQALRYN
jgi:putative ABC transport system permease protein